jgi:hypothetical protein
MKSKILFFAGLAMLSLSCSLDNYETPNSGLYGAIIDDETGEYVQQDIYMGTHIYFKEQGYANPALQSMVIKNNGEYRNTMMFRGSYEVYTTIESNFEPVEPFIINLDGLRNYDFRVKPFIRVTDARVNRTGNKIKAACTVQQVSSDSNVKTVALFVSTQPTVGKYLNDALVEINVGRKCTTPTNLTVELNLDDFPELREGKTYYFRIGALSGRSGAKYNYAPAQELKL